MMDLMYLQQVEILSAKARKSKRLGYLLGVLVKFAQNMEKEAQ